MALSWLNAVTAFENSLMLIAPPQKKRLPRAKTEVRQNIRFRPKSAYCSSSLSH